MMFYFPELFLQAIIVGALLFSGISAVTLVVLLIRDKQKNEVW